MRPKNPRYSIEEKNIIKKCISENFVNKSEACQKASKEILEKTGRRRCYTALLQYWNTSLKKEDEVFRISSKDAIFINSKNLNKNASSTTKALFKRIEDRVVEEVVKRIFEELIKQ